MLDTLTGPVVEAFDVLDIYCTCYRMCLMFLICLVFLKCLTFITFVRDVLAMYD